MKLCYLLIVLFLFLGEVQDSSHASPLEIQIEPESDDNFAYGVFQCWLPPGGAKPKAVLGVILHPRDGRASTLQQPESWQRLAAEYDCALVSFSFASVGESERSWGRARLGSGRALLRALSEFGRVTAVPEVASAPVILAGVCEAGQYAYEFAGEYPEKTLAFVTIGGGRHDLALARCAAPIPALMVVTPDRGEEATANIVSLYLAGRSKAAPWGLAIESMAKYDTASNGGVVAAFLRAALRRLSVDPLTPRLALLNGKLFSLGLAGVDTDFVRPLNLPPRMSDQLATRSASAWYPDEATIQAVKAQASAAGDSLPFPAEAIQEAATVSMPRVGLGTRRFDDPAAACRFSFEVTAREGSYITSVEAFETPHLRQMRTEKIAADQWRTTGEVDLSTLPAGSFKIELPVRCFAGPKKVFGGRAVSVLGSVFGDVVVGLTTVNFGTVRAGQTACAAIKLKSLSGSPIELENIRCSGRNMSGVNLVAQGDRLTFQVEMPIDVATPPGTVFSGYLSLKTRSSEEREIKLLYYGNTPKS